MCKNHVLSRARGREVCWPVPGIYDEAHIHKSLSRGLPNVSVTACLNAITAQQHVSTMAISQVRMTELRLHNKLYGF